MWIVHSQYSFNTDSYFYFFMVCFFFIFQCTEYDFDYGTECLHLAQKYADTNALLIDGPEFLWKVISFTSGAKTAINTNHDENQYL